MFSKSQIALSNRIKIIAGLGPLAGLALITSFFGLMENPNLDFLTGFLVRFSNIGNLVYIFVVSRHLRENWR